MSLCLLFLTLSATPPIERVTIEFIGFSNNELAAAWRSKTTDMHEKKGAKVYDSFGLVILADVRSHEVISTFRDGNIQRRDALGRRMRAKQKQLLADNPAYGDARPARQWNILKRKVRWRKNRMDMSDNTVRLSPDEDAIVEAKASEEAIEIYGAPGSPLGYSTISFDMDGGLRNIGRFRADAQEGARINARVEVFFSKTGHSIATIGRHKFHQGGKTKRQDKIRLVRLEEFAIASTKVGAMNYVRSNLRTAEKAFKKMHPQSADLYDQYVGRYW